MFSLLTIIFGSFVGFSLGLTGGGGSLFAVPLLVYGLGIQPREAFGISLAAVGSTSLIGVIPLIRAHLVDVKTGLLFSVAGAAGAPLGTWTAGKLPEHILLLSFSMLMFFIAVHMWRKSNQTNYEVQTGTSLSGPACKRSPQGTLHFNTPCALLLTGVGFCSGILSGMYGVGGGFIIVPALVMFSRMPIHQAVATSLLVIVVVSISGVISHVAAGTGISKVVTVWFIVGGVVGLILGRILSGSLSGSALQKIFAVGIIGVALFIVLKTIL